MKWTLVTFSDENFLLKRKFLSEHATNCGMENISYTKDWIKGTDFYKKNLDIFNDEVGFGYFIWKPFIIRDAMDKMSDGDILFYCDCGDIFHPGIVKLVENIIEDDCCLLPLGGFINKNWSKRDCFVYMNCDDESYWESLQLEAGIGFWKVCDQSKKIVDEWIEYSQDRRIISDDKNVCEKENFPEFNEHRRDQSILTNIAIKYGLSVIGSEIRDYIECNYEYWYERNSKEGFNLKRPIDKLLVELRDKINA